MKRLSHTHANIFGVKKKIYKLAVNFKQLRTIIILLVKLHGTFDFMNCREIVGAEVVVTVLMKTKDA